MTPTLKCATRNCRPQNQWGAGILMSELYGKCEVMGLLTRVTACLGSDLRKDQKGRR